MSGWNREAQHVLAGTVGYPDPATVVKIATGNTGTGLKKHTAYLIIADADSFFKWGGTASSADMYLPAKTYLRVFSGPNTVLGGSGGNLYAIELVEDTLPEAAHSSSAPGFGN